MGLIGLQNNHILMYLQMIEFNIYLLRIKTFTLRMVSDEIEIFACYKNHVE